MLDPDRFFDSSVPGSHEWWYFDAIGDDGRDALVVVWYAALPFDPAYGVATLKWLRDPARRPPPWPRDHCAIGLSWYRDGKTLAYALNAFRRDAFRCQVDPFQVEVAGCRLLRDEGVYRLGVDTPAVDGRHRIVADLEFRPAGGTVPFERDLGGTDYPHVWMLAAADNRVAGSVRVIGPAPAVVEFRGRGYHDHNAGAEEISRSIRRWRWGRVHHGDRTEIYYQSEPHVGGPHALHIVCRDGAPVQTNDRPDFGFKSLRRNRFGIRHDRRLRLGDGLERRCGRPVDDGPFYLRWLAEYESGGRRDLGFSEHLDTGHLNSPWFNWMIPYRLKRPSQQIFPSPPSPRDVPLRPT